MFFSDRCSYFLAKKVSRRDTHSERRKRVCNRMARLDDLFGSSVDSLFLENENEIVRRVATLNHSTRTWLAMKFVRKNKHDFQPGACLTFRYSQRKICRLLDIDRGSINRLIELSRDARLVDILPEYRYLSPMEANPRGRKRYFKRIASNYHDLLESNFFD